MTQRPKTVMREVSHLAPDPPDDSLQLFDARGRRRPPRWIAAAQRRDAAKAAWYGRPAAEVAADVARLEDRLFHRASWRVASTMPENPHCYTRRRSWTWPDGDEDFQWVVATIRIIGTREKYPPSGPRGIWYLVLYLGGARYWTMNWPLDYPNGTPCTTLINRTPPVLPGDRR